jgi:5'-deoxynucleotidase YfbR-like HD superfamily hydrolase
MADQRTGRVKEMRQVDSIPYPAGKLNEQRPFGNWMISFKGNRLYPLDLMPDDIDIEEIAHALSNICRFGGHCKEFYSVAQHSVIVCDLLSDEYKLCGLLHDSSEAYCGDMVRPLKQHLPEFQTIENDIWLSISLKFDVPFVIPRDVQIEDARVLLMEKRDLLAYHEHEWTFPQCAFPNLTIPDDVIVPIEPKAARDLFLTRFYQLWEEKSK